MNRSRRLRQRLLDGRYRWGTATRQTGRYGSESVRLRIHPPEATTADRRLARLARLWPGIGSGVVLLLGLAVPAATPVPARLAFAVAAILVICIGVILGRTTEPVRAGTTEVFATVSLLSPREVDQRRFEYAETLLTLLDEAERALNEGEIPWDVYQATWISVYREARTTIPEHD